ncbi:hypothetical protein DPMN_111463 [Dreissena polymorpha]|uniref:Uncharacterized protein n=1 Tax=Dreissena polymorpha TaxID=45954 RepID=A0A9D4KDW7_DREPO|nr:hypothetical protein DPMN_111463 [Dreissena polymorpha]
MPELNPHRQTSLPVCTKTRTTLLIYVPSSLDSVQIGSKVTTVPTFKKMSRALFKIVGNISCPLFILILKLWKNESYTFH